MQAFLISFGYVGLFLSAFLSATILPGGSELVMGGLVVSNFNLYFCLAVATFGNSLGGVLNYYFGRVTDEEWAKKHMKISEERLIKVKKFVEEKGTISAFFSFTPLVGDIIPYILGFFKANIYKVSFYIFLGKLLRYALVLIGLKYGIAWLS
ncbi:MAG: Inner membrane protein YqaA [Alphaproteobacteria bacterium ADurb.Bin438]|nr:MAG: Inner membrane protein YqaA [Alphaproteobacteria bacterium ADurb.Bin438]